MVAASLFAKQKQQLTLPGWKQNCTKTIKHNLKSKWIIQIQTDSFSPRIIKNYYTISYFFADLYY